jgi:hypothetical protein
MDHLRGETGGQDGVVDFGVLVESGTDDEVEGVGHSPVVL